mmetsp:Transcript_30690/g.60245  ORF Transcript_30690/g.60245 Transcript_30690/m.60245 type:complete len:468 (+) Transcript_30690:46-1449(+)
MMKLVYLISTLSLCYPVFSDRDPDCSSKLTPEAELKCKFAKRKRSSSLAERTSIATVINNDISLHVEAMRDENGVGQFHVKALETVTAAIELFAKKSYTVHDITEGVSVIALGLWDCMDMFVPEQTRELEVYKWFKRAWSATFTTLRSLDAAEIEGRIEAFNENGQGHEIAHVVYLCVDSAVDLIDKFVNGTVAEKISPWFMGVRSITKGVAKSWEAFANGEAVKGAEAVYEAIREASDAVLPENLKNNTVYQTITKVLDKQIGKLNEYVMGFKKDLAEESICLRGTWSRTSKLPQICPEDRILHRQCCDTKALGMFIQEWEAGARNELLQFTRETCEKKPDCEHPLQCPFNFDTQRCLAECPEGFREAKSKEFCWQDCPADFPHHAEDGLKCARNTFAITMLNTQRLLLQAELAAQGLNLFNQIANQGLAAAADSMNDVIESGVKFAQTYSFASCEMPEVLPSVEC